MSTASSGVLVVVLILCALILIWNHHLFRRAKSVNLGKLASDVADAQRECQIRLASVVQAEAKVARAKRAVLEEILKNRSD